MKNQLFVLFFLFSLTPVTAQQNLKPSQYFSLKGVVELKSDGSVTVYNVPPDSCLIVTDVYINESNGHSYPQVYANDVSVLRVENGEWLNLTTGILFKAGTAVNFRN